MTTTPTGLAAAPPADLITLGVRGQEGAFGPVSQRC
jgi:hypothetical protein